MSEKQLVQFNSPKKLLDEFDKTWKALSFADRTTALNQLMREFIQKYNSGFEANAKVST